MDSTECRRIAPAQGLNLSDTHDMHPTAFSGPLHISELPLPLGGTLGLVHCPGRQGPDSSGQRWSRTLSADLQQIKEFGATTVLTLVSTAEDRKSTRLNSSH